MLSYQPLVSSLRKLTIANQTAYSNVTLETPDLHSIDVGNTTPIKGQTLLKDSKKYQSESNLPLTKQRAYLESHKIEKESEEIVKNFIVNCVLNDGKLSRSRLPDVRSDPDNELHFKTPQKYNIFDVRSPLEKSLEPTERVTKAYAKLERKFNLTPQQQVIFQTLVSNKKLNTGNSRHFASESKTVSEFKMRNQQSLLQLKKIYYEQQSAASA